MERKTKTTAELFREDLEALLAKYDTEQRSEAVKRGMKQMVSRGYLPTRPPLGYSKTKTTGLFEPNRDGRWLEDVLRAYAEDRIETQEAVKLVASMLRKKYGKQPTQRQVRDVFINPYYTGYIFWDGNLYEGRHVALISLEQHWVIHHKLNQSLPEKSEGN